VIVDVTDWVHAAYLHYNGCQMITCLTSGYDSTTWKFDLPAHDWGIIQTEMTDDQQSVYMTAFIKSIKIVQNVQKQSCELLGVWTARSAR